MTECQVTPAPAGGAQGWGELPGPEVLSGLYSYPTSLFRAVGGPRGLFQPGTVPTVLPVFYSLSL